VKKSNLILQAAIAAALASGSAAYAGNLTGTTTFATEVFGATQTAAAEIIPTPVTYTFSTPGGIVINPGGTIYMYFREAGGVFTAAPAAGDISFGGGLAGLSVSGAPALSTDFTTVRVALNNPVSNAVNVTIGVGGKVILTPAATRSISGVNTTLATAGGAVTMQASVATTSSLPNTGTALPSDLETATAINIAVAANAISSTMAASSAFPFNSTTAAPNVTETQRIDLTAAAPSSRLTTPGGTLSNTNSATVVNLGAFRFTNSTTPATLLDGTTAYTIALRSSNLTGTVSGAFKSGAGSAITMTSDAACATVVATAAYDNTSVPTVATFPAAPAFLPTTATNYYLCYTVPATTGAIPVTQPTLALTLNKTAGTDKTNTVGGSLYNLQLNGQQVDVRSYIPVGNTGYTGFVRVINTGSVAAPITGQFLYENGTSGTAGVLIGSLPPAGVQTLTANQVETAIGAPTGGAAARPRLRVTAPTNGMNVQSFMASPGGLVSDMTGAQ